MRFWLNHAIAPLAIFILIILFFKVTNLDIRIANLFFNFEAKHWYLGESWWTVTFIHKWGRNLIVILLLLSLVGFVISLFPNRFRPYLFVFLYITLTILFSTGIVAALKHFSNIDCPWDLSLYNGTDPYFHLFSDKSTKLTTGRCFPGGHSSGGFSLLLFYFLFRDYNKRYAYIGLALAILIGLVFSFGQWSRGAHFVTHDLWSAMICWFVALSLYKIVLKPGMRSLAK